MLSRVIRFTRAVIVGAFIIAGAGCEGAPDAPEYDNPIIPGDPNYVPPQTTILSGPAEDAVIDTHTVTFTWRGNQDDMDFIYLHYRYGHWRSDSSVSEVLTDTSVTFQYLDEGNYLFSVSGRYRSGIEEDSPAQRRYSVDDIHGPALYLYPRYQQVDVGEEFAVEVVLEEVENVFAVKVVLEFDPAALQVSNVEIYEDNRSLLKANGGTVIPFSSYDNAVGTITIEVVTATGNPVGVSGSGAVARITLTADKSGELSFGIGTSLRDPDNRNITLMEQVAGVVELR